MARILIVACGCRGRALGSALREQGHAVRGTAREPAGLAQIEAAGLEPWRGDPHRLGTLTSALEAVTVLCWLLGDARGAPERMRELHDERLRRMLEEMIDTTVRGFVYERAGGVQPEVLDRGGAIVSEASERHHVPVAFIDSEPADHAVWLASALAAVEGLLAA